MKKEHIIWSNIGLNLDDWRDDLLDDEPDLSEYELHEKMHEINSEYIDDERMNLNVTLSRPIIAIANLGLWNGRRTGYQIIGSGNIRDCLYSNCDYCKWYVDETGEFCFTGIHHDGTNYHTYRVFRDSATDSQIEKLKDLLYDGEATQYDIDKVTKKIGRAIGKVYGWKFSNNKTA